MLQPCDCVGKSGLLQLRPEHESVPDISEMMEEKTLMLFPSLFFAQICLPLAKARGRGYRSITPASAGTLTKSQQKFSAQPPLRGIVF